MITIRDATESDLNFIYATWLKALYYGHPWYRAIDKEAFFKNYQLVIKGILDKSAVKASVACLADTPDVILAWAVLGSNGPLHFIYVKPSWRQQGIATRLVQDCSELSSVTHITELADGIRLKKQLKFNPWLI